MFVVFFNSFADEEIEIELCKAADYSCKQSDSYSLHNKTNTALISNANGR